MNDQHQEVRRPGRRAAGAGAAGALTSAGAAATATAAVACCMPIVSPLLVAAVGASGAVWVTGLRPYSPYLLLFSAVLLAFSFHRVYGPRERCTTTGSGASGAPIRRAWPIRVVRLVFWVSVLLWSGGAVLYLLYVVGAGS